MKISEAKSAYYKQYQKFSFAASDVARKKEEAEKNARLHPDKADEFNKEAATLEISLEGLQKQADAYMKHNEKIAEAECAYANMFIVNKIYIRTTEKKVPKRVVLYIRRHPEPIESETQTLMVQDSPVTCQRSPWYENLTKNFYLSHTPSDKQP